MPSFALYSKQVKASTSRRITDEEVKEFSMARNPTFKKQLIIVASKNLPGLTDSFGSHLAT